LKRKDFRVAGVQQYKRPDMSTIQVLNEIFNNRFEATMLMTPFTVQVLIPKHNTSQIDNMITTLKETSKWISTNKRTSAEKPISKRLAEELTTIMTFSTPHQREYFQPKLEAKFKYQVDCDKDKFDKICNKQNGNKWVMLPEMLSSKDFSKYIKDPFNKDTTNEYLKKLCHVPKWLGPKVNTVYLHTVFL
jgi:hypothetical protein